MSGADYYSPGDWNVACSLCGRKRKASTMVKNWQGMWRCPPHNEPRQPQDFVRNVKDDMSVPFSQPQIDVDIFTGIVCTWLGRGGVAGQGITGCSVAGLFTF